MAMAPQPPQTPQRLLEALKPLDGGDLSTPQRLSAIQDACSALVQVVEGGGHLPTGLLLAALEAVSRGLGAARQQVEAAQSQLAAVRQAAWSQAVLAAADACMFSEAWHAAWHADAAGGPAGYRRSVELARDMLKHDLLPLLCAASAQQDGATGFCLGEQYRALLAMGCTAAEIVGMRDPRHRRPGVRNFSVLNVLWNGIQQLWVEVPAAARADMERQGLGAAEAVGAVLRATRRDVRACHLLLDTAVVKLLLYWLQKARYVLTSYPTAAPAVCKAVLEVPLCLVREAALLQGLGGAAAAAPPAAAQLAQALEAQVLPRAVGLLAFSLGGVVADDQLRVMVDELRVLLSSGEAEGQRAALQTVLQLLHSAPSMAHLARQHSVPLLGSVLDALPCAPAALQSEELREQVADAALVFLATCCHAAASAPGNEALAPWERQLAAQSWERCQQCLFQHALQPHPLTAHVLGSVWSDLAAMASELLLTDHMGVLHDLLRLVAAAEAGGGYAPPSPLHLQLLGLAACLLSVAPPPVADAFQSKFLQYTPGMQEDACQLACLAAELRLATLVDAAAGSSAAALRVQAALHALFARLMEAGPLLMRQAAARGDGADASAECTYLAWLLEALRCAVGYLAATNAQQGDDAVLGQLPARLVTLLARTARHGVFGCAAPALGALCDLQELWGRGQGAGEREPVGPEQLEELVPALAAYQQRPELAPAVAALIPSLASCDVPHTHLVHAALAAAPPLLQHLGMEALRRYARLCPAASLLAALPPALKDPGTGQALPGVRDVIAQYVARTPNGAWQVDPEEAAAWAAALRQEALGAAPALRRAVEALRARAEAACNGSPPEAASNGAALAAAQQVASSIQAAEAALAAAPLDPAAAQVLQQCSARLAQLLGQVA